MKKVALLLIGFFLLAMALIPIQEKKVKIPKSPNLWDMEALDGQRFKWNLPLELEIPQLTYSVENLWAEFDRPIYLTAWLFPSLLISKKASWEGYKKFIDTLIELDGPNSYRAFAAAVWEQETVNIVRFPFLKVNGKFDLEQMNPEWLDETLRRIEYFVNRGGVVIYTLIDRCSMYENRNGWWKFHWWNGNKNINGTNIQSKSVRHMYNWTDRGILGAKETKYYVLKFMKDMVRILEKRFPGSIVYDFNELSSNAEWYLNVDRDVFQKFNIPHHRKMFSIAGGGTDLVMYYGDIAEIMREYIWQPHGICSLEAYYNIYLPAAGLVHPSADGCAPPASREQAKWIVFNSLMDGMIGFENNRYWDIGWERTEENFWKQADWNIAKGIKEGFLMWYDINK